MSKTLKLRLIKKRESYSFKQISELLCVHQRTVQAWKQEGLKTINDSKPFLVMGYDLQEFLNQKQQNRKCTLQENEFYCMKCRKAVKSLNNEVCIEVSTKTIGKHGFKALTVKGYCEFCNSLVNKFSHEGKLEEIKNTFNIVNLRGLGHE